MSTTLMSTTGATFVALGDPFRIHYPTKILCINGRCRRPNWGGSPQTCMNVSRIYSPWILKSPQCLWEVVHTLSWGFSLDLSILYSVSQKNSADLFWHFFRKRLEIFSPNFTLLLHVPTYAGIQIFIQLTATLTKLCHVKRDHHRAQNVRHRPKRTLTACT